MKCRCHGISHITTLSLLVMIQSFIAPLASANTRIKRFLIVISKGCKWYRKATFAAKNTISISKPSNNTDHTVSVVGTIWDLLVLNPMVNKWCRPIEIMVIYAAEQHEARVIWSQLLLPCVCNRTWSITEEPSAEQPCVHKQDEIESKYAKIGNLRYLKPKLTCLKCHCEQNLTIRNMDGCRDNQQ